MTAVILAGPNPDKVLHWHNMRTSTLPPLHGGSSRYWAIRVSKVCHVIKMLTGKTFKNLMSDDEAGETFDTKITQPVFGAATVEQRQFATLERIVERVDVQGQGIADLTEAVEAIAAKLNA